MRRDTLLLLGSGFSRPAGYPSVADLTRVIVDSTGPTRPIEELREEAWDLVSAFTARYCDGREANYEDLAYVLRQIADFETCNMEDPAAEAILCELSRRMGADVHEVARSAVALHDLIRQDVCQWLWPHGDDGGQDYPASLLARVEERLAGIVSLNHDLLLEQSVPRFHQRFADGFREGEPSSPGPFVDAFDGDAVPFVKLHGSVSWRHARVPNSDGTFASTVVTSRACGGWDASRIKSKTGIDLNGPALLIGSFSKAFDYHIGIFRDLYWRAEALLRPCRRLVAIGFGFGDQAINGSLIGWMMKSGARRIYVRDIDPETMLARARKAIRRQFGHWCDQGRVVLDAGGAEEAADSDQLAAFLQSR